MSILKKIESNKRKRIASLALLNAIEQLTSNSNELKIFDEKDAETIKQVIWSASQSSKRGP